MSNEDDLSAEVVACDRAGSRGDQRRQGPAGSANSGTSWTSNGARFQKSATAVASVIAFRSRLPSPICDGIPGAPSSWSPKADVLRGRTP